MIGFLKSLWLNLVSKKELAETKRLFNRPLCSEEIDIVRHIGLTVSVEVKGRSRYYLPTDEQKCRIIFCESLGQYFILKKILPETENRNYCKAVVRSVSSLEIKTLTFPKRILYLSEQK